MNTQRDLLSFACLCLCFTGGVYSETVQPDSITETHTIDEIVVTGTRNAISKGSLPTTVSIVSRDQLTQDYHLNILPALMEQVPGLMVTGRGVMGYGVSTGGSGGMMLRGISSTAGQVMVLIDGHPQYNGIYGHSVADSYPTMTAERVEVLRGPASVLYGSNAMGGVVNILTRHIPQDTIKTDISVGAGSYRSFQAEASNQIHKGPYSSLLAAQYERSDNHRPNMGFEQYGGTLKLNYDIHPNWNAYADATLTHFNASQPGTISAPIQEADQWITRGTASLGIENHFRKTNGRISVYDNFGRHKINDGYSANGGTPQTRFFRSKDALVGITAYQNVEVWKGSRLTLGIDYQHIYGRAYYTDRQTGEVLETTNKQSGTAHNNEVGTYVDWHQQLWRWFAWDAGLRYDYHTVTHGEWVPQGGVVIHPIRNGALKATISKGFRNPTMREMYLYPSSNEELLPERMVNYELSWQHNLLSNRLTYAANLFYIHTDNIIQTINRKNINTGELFNTGMELEATWQINRHWRLNTNHSYLHMENPVTAAPTYKGYLGTNMQYDKWELHVGLQQLCGLYIATGEAEQKETFTLLNATIGFQPIQCLHLWMRGENLLAQQYEIISGYPMPKATIMAGFDINF